MNKIEYRCPSHFSVVVLENIGFHLLEIFFNTCDKDHICVHFGQLF